MRKDQSQRQETKKKRRLRSNLILHMRRSATIQKQIVMPLSYPNCGILLLFYISLSLTLQISVLAWVPSLAFRITSSPRKCTSLSESASLSELLDRYDDERNVPLLEAWAEDQGITLADGVKLVNNGLGDWGVGLSESHALKAHDPIVTIPQCLTLSSKDAQVQEFHNDIVQSMSLTKQIDNGLPMSYYSLECLLMLRVLQEKDLGDESRWYSWLETLPKEFATGLYLDPLERSHVKRVASTFLEVQEQQFDACRQAFEDIHDRLPQSMQSYLSSNPDALRWAYSVVFTRSWPMPGRESVTLVPVGDFFNHKSQANVAPRSLGDGTIQLFAKYDLAKGSPLYLSYGLGDFPGRFLVTFGFWDRSSDYMDANLTVPEKLPVDSAELIVSTRNGRISDEVLCVGVYQFLSQRDPEEAEKLAIAKQEQNQIKVDAFCSKYDLEGALWLRLHALKVVSEIYPEMDIAPENLSESPRRFGMIARYNNGMRESWIRVIEYLESEMNDAVVRRDRTNKKKTA